MEQLENYIPGIPSKEARRVIAELEAEGGVEPESRITIDPRFLANVDLAVVRAIQSEARAGMPFES